jgi:8-oxo-dGTP diphosphatase
MIDERERLVCQECGFIFYINPKVAAGVLVEEEGQVVLVRRGIQPCAGYWALPSGFAEYGETIEETAVRECHEETGLEVELDDLLGVYSVNSDFYGCLVLVLYSGHVVGGELAAGDDASEAGLFAPDELPTNIAFWAHRQALCDWKEAIISSQEVAPAG